MVVYDAPFWLLIFLAFGAGVIIGIIISPR